MASTQKDTDDKNKELYEVFHSSVTPIGEIPREDDWMYHFLLQPLSGFLRPGMRVLDVGCGNGIISLFVANRGCHVTGIDISEQAIEASQLAAQNLGLSKYATFSATLLQDLPKEPEYDCIILSEVLEHLHDDKEALSIIYSLLKTDGVLYITVPSERALSHRIKKAVKGRDEFDEYVGHLRRYSVGSLTELVKNEHFKITNTTTAEGPFRNAFLISSRLAPVFYFLVRHRMRRPFEAFDKLAKKIFGESQIILVAKKVADNTN